MDLYSWSRTIHLAPENQVGDMECSFRSLEFVNSMYVGEGTKVPMPKLSEITYSGIRQVPDKGAQVEKGLGKRLQGMLRSIAVIEKKY